MNPPQIPTITKALASAGSAKRPSPAVNVPKNPMTKEPTMLIRMVPQGKAGPVTRPTASASQARAMLPSAPPTATER